MLKSVTGMRMMHVPFNGSSPSLTALMGGQVQVAVDTVVASTPLVKAGRSAPLPPWGRSGWSCCQTCPRVAAGFDMGTWFDTGRFAGPVQRKLEKALADVMAGRAWKRCWTWA